MKNQIKRVLGMLESAEAGLKVVQVLLSCLRFAKEQIATLLGDGPGPGAAPALA